MQVIDTAIPDCKIIEPKVFGDARGSFMESFNAKLFEEKVAPNVNFVQDNQSVSCCAVFTIKSKTRKANSYV
jgi:dTDP-4-dehydrorhamnose 3,5-epimerase